MLNTLISFVFRRRKITFLLGLASLVITTGLKINELTAHNDVMILSATDFIIRHFTHGRPVIIILPGSTGNIKRNSPDKIFIQEYEFKMSDILLKNVNEQTYWPLYVFCCYDTTGTMPDNDKLYHSYIIFIRSETGGDASSNIIRQLNYLKENYLLNSRGRFLVVVNSPTSDTTSDVAFRVLNAAWKYLIVDVILMVVSVPLNINNSNHLKSNELIEPVIDLFTFLPYSKEQNCSNVKSITHLYGLFPNYTEKSIPKKINLLPNRNIKNLYRCPVKVSTYHNPPTIVDTSSGGFANCTGLEVNVLVFILQSLNATVAFKIIPPTNGSFFGTYANVLSDLDSGSADIVIGALPLHEILYVNYDPTVPYFYTPVQWVVPCPKPSRRWGTIFKVFPLSVWLCIFICFVVVIIVMWLVASSSEHFNYSSVQYCLLSAWAVVLGTSAPKKPQTPSVRLIFLSWIWVSFALCVIFQAFFTTFLVNPGFDRKIKTMDDLLRSGIKYGYTVDYGLVADYTVKTSNLKKCLDPNVCLEYAIKYGNYATVSNTFHTDYYRAKLSWHDSHLTVCTMDDDIIHVNVVMYLTKGHPLLQQINEATKAMVESGLMEKWKNDFMYTSRLHSLLANVDNYEIPEGDWNSDYFVFSLTHLRSAFMVLMLGNILSVSALFIEVIYCKIHFRNPVRKPVRYKRISHFKRRLENSRYRFSRYR